MTTGIGLDGGPGGRRWAAELLGVQEDAPVAAVRRAYLVKLREDDFIPQRSLRLALRALEGKGTPSGPDEDWLLEEESRLRAEVESFAGEFFDVPVGERRRRWDALLSACRSVPPLAARLQMLQAGLEVQTEGLPSSPSFPGQLAQELLQAFPLPLLGRAAARQAFLRRIEDPSAASDRRSWEAVARQFVAERPALASLDRAWVQHVAELRSRLEHRKKLDQRGSRESEATPADDGQRIPWWTVWLVISLLGAVLRGVTSSNTPSSKEPSRSISPVFPDIPKMPELPRGPDLRELCDPTKFDVEILDPESKTARLFRFKPRPGSTQALSDGQPLMYGAATLMLMGLTPEQVEALRTRAKKAKLP